MRLLRYHTQRGFSLVELSIVLVILGLLVGGVLGGQALIRAAEIRGVLADKDKYLAAVYTFKNKYHALPGDMANAGSFWGVVHANNIMCIVTAAATATATCNGNGNGRIERSFALEESNLWRHMANAGMVEGNYPHGTTGSELRWGKTKGAHEIWMETMANRWHIDYANSTLPVVDIPMLILATNTSIGPGGGFSHVYRLNAFTTSEAWGIDTKLDDGRPGLGKMMVSPNNFPASSFCSTSADATTAEYNLTYSNKACTPTFIIKF